MKSKILLFVTGFNMLAQADKRGNVAAIVTKPSKDNPSATGVHLVSEGQLRRIMNRCLGFESVVAFKHLIELSNGNAQLTIDAELIKPGDKYTKADGSTGIYEGAKNPDGTIKGDGSWTKYSNHELKLATVAVMKLSDIAIQQGLAGAMQGIPVTRKAEVVAEEPKEDVKP